MEDLIWMIPTRIDDPYIATRIELPVVRLEHAHTALLVIDVQYECAHPDYGWMKRARDHGRDEDTTYFQSRMTGVLPRIASLQAAFRTRGIPVLHTRIESLTNDGRDRSPEHKLIGINVRPHSKGADFLPEVAPLDDEIVLSKTSSSPFNSTNLDYLLRNLDVQNIVVCGIVTTGCVESAVRDAADRGFRVVLVEDACAAVVEEMHYASVRAVRDVYAKIYVTEEVIAQLG